MIVSFDSAWKRAAALGALLSIAACSSNSPGDVVASGRTALPQPDSAFVIGAGESSNAEIAAAQLAQQKSTNPDVLSFAAGMIKDHTQENADLATATQSTAPQAPPPPTVNPMQAAEAAKLMTLTGAAFDQEYVNSEIQGHTLNLNNNYVPETSGGQNPAILAYAKQYQPQIQMHLTMIQSIATKDSL